MINELLGIQYNIAKANVTDRKVQNLRLNLTLPLRLQGLGTGGWLNLTRQDSPAIYNQLTKANKVSSAR